MRAILLLATVLLPSLNWAADGTTVMDENSALVESGHLVTTVRVTGKVIPVEGAMFVQAARVSGRILEILKREGEHVSPGTPLYRISSAECTSLSEELRVAKERQLTDLINAVERRQSRLDLKLTQEDCQLLASAQGTITRRFFEPGANFNSGDALAHIVDPSRVTVEFDVPEKDASRISVGTAVTVRLANSDTEYKTKIRTVVPTLDPATRTTKVRVSPIHFTRPPSIESFAVADIETDSPEQTLIVPSASLIFHQGRQWVLRVQAKEKPVPVAVDVLSETGEKSSIKPLSGSTLTPGQKVMTKGAVFAFKHLRSEGT